MWFFQGIYEYAQVPPDSGLDCSLVSRLDHKDKVAVRPNVAFSQEKSQGWDWMAIHASTVYAATSCAGEERAMNIFKNAVAAIRGMGDGDRPTPASLITGNSLRRSCSDIYQFNLPGNAG
jgi:hypothetical protein